MMAARLIPALLVVLALGGCGGDRGNTATAASSTPTGRQLDPGVTPLHAYVHQTSQTFERVLAARRQWEDADRLSAIRRAAEELAARERAMLRYLRSTIVPAEVGDRHPRMIAELVAQSRALRRLCASRRLDTDAVDTQVGRTFAVEQIVNELFALRPVAR